MEGFPIVFGLFAIPAILLVIICGTTAQEKLKCSVIIFMFWLGVSCACWAQTTGNAEKWNGGYCDCGTHWELAAVSRIRMTTIKYYTCPECFNEIEIKE